MWIDPVTSSIYLSRSTGHAISVALDDTRGRGAPLRGIYVIRVAERTDSHRNDSAQRWTDRSLSQVRNSRASRSRSSYFHPRLCRPRGNRRTASERLPPPSRATSGHAIPCDVTSADSRSHIVDKCELRTGGERQLPSTAARSPPPFPTTVVPRDICHYATAVAGARVTPIDRDRVYWPVIFIVIVVMFNPLIARR